MIQQILDKNKNKLPRLGTSAAALLTGTLKCSKCGKSMIVKHGHISSQTNKKIQYYVCSTKDYSKGERCNNPNVRTDKLESIVIDNLKKLTINKEVLLEELYKIKSEISKNDYMLGEIDNLPKQIKIKQSQLDVLISQLTYDNEISKFIRPQIMKLGEELDKLKYKYENLKATSDEYKNLKWDSNKFLDPLYDFSSLIEILDFKNKRLLINNIIHSVYWDGDKRTVKINLMSIKP